MKEQYLAGEISEEKKVPLTSYLAGRVAALEDQLAEARLRQAQFSAEFNKLYEYVRQLDNRTFGPQKED